MNNFENLSRYLFGLLALTNKQFITECFKVIMMYRFNDEEIGVLTDINKLNRTIISRNRYTYPILKEVKSTGRTTEAESQVNGNRRYYDEKYTYNGKSYILCTDWYHHTAEKENQKETMIPFIKWILSVVSNKNVQSLSTPENN
jgi:hypothetical protein